MGSSVGLHATSCLVGPFASGSRGLRGQVLRPLQPDSSGGSLQTSVPRRSPSRDSVCPAIQLQASGLPGSAELTAGAAIAYFLALEGADLSYANHRGRSPLDLAAEGRLLKALQGCAQRFR